MKGDCLSPCEGISADSFQVIKQVLALVQCAEETLPLRLCVLEVFDPRIFFLGRSLAPLFDRAKTGAT